MERGLAAAIKIWPQGFSRIFELPAGRRSTKSKLLTLNSKHYNKL